MTREEQNLWYNETLWGNTKVDWIALGSCHVLNQSNNNYAVWEDSFKGLHSIVGWDTEGVCHEDLGLVFALNIKGQDPRSIWEAWKFAGDYCIHSPGYSVGILAVDIDGNLNTKECIEDHIYAQGEIWYSPTGYNPNFDTDFYECDPD